MRESHQFIKEIEGSRVGACVDGMLVLRLDHFEVLCAEIVPDQFVHRIERVRNTEFGKQIVNFRQCLIEFGFKPIDGQLVRGGQIGGYLPTLRQAEGIPDFITKIPALLHQFFVVG